MEVTVNQITLAIVMFGMYTTPYNTLALHIESQTSGLLQRVDNWGIVGMMTRHAAKKKKGRTPSSLPTLLLYI